MRSFRLLIAVLFLSSIVPVHADVSADPPARVGRLGYFEGTVSFHTQDQTQWYFGAVNYPVTSGMSFWTEPGAKAEFQIGGDVIRMDSSTEVQVLRLDAATTQIVLQQGALNYRVVSLEQGETIEVETVNGAVALTQLGTYHLEAGTAQTPSIAAAFEGEARFIGEHSFLDIGTGEQGSAIGVPANYTLSTAEPNAFDDWCLARDKREHDSETVKYVSPEVTGYQDLDQYGQWQSTPEYGYVWTPQEVPAGWQPYHAGHWAWVQPWGWTWIDDQPWGFAPFHYGRWANYNNAWVWVPGQERERPVYAPALVAFTGDIGPGIVLGGAAAILAGAVGWVPLGPREPYFPPYSHNAAYVRGINENALGRVGAESLGARGGPQPHNFGGYANAQAAVVMPQRAFASARPVQQAMTPVTPQQIASAPTVASISSIRPTAIARSARPAAAAQPATAQAARAPAASTPPAVAAPLAVHPTTAAVKQSHTETQRVESGPGPAVKRVAPQQYRLRQPEVVSSLAATAPQQANAAAHDEARRGEQERARASQEQAAQEQAAKAQAVQQQEAQALQVRAAQAQAAKAQATRAQADAQANAARVQSPKAAPVYQKAELPHPAQPAQLHPTPAGWQRAAAANPAKDPKPDHQEPQKQ